LSATFLPAITSGECLTASCRARKLALTGRQSPTPTMPTVRHIALNLEFDNRTSSRRSG
jgi:hypothetical protein